jgi:hypothetical protein
MRLNIRDNSVSFELLFYYNYIKFAQYNSAAESDY